ncbi:hypothetical protein BLNAU_13953 [Blattamonas nauphoetae]|uniref:Uncharacterized protein n=1 Tax=Blattamonas nauphoetae TaxID=2049346 RepID=A0ABQ9XI47_9EUKA|nr:hypothetical protein BLNAU_13953 [Blattamonas nauphoetae]
MFKAATLSDAAPFDNIPTNSSNRSSTSAEEKSNNAEGPHGWDVDMLHLESNMTIFAYVFAGNLLEEQTKIRSDKMILGLPFWSKNLVRCFSSSLVHLGPTPLVTLPPMDFTYPSHFSIMHTTIVHAIDDSNGNSFWSSVLLSNPFTSGVVSITMTLLSKRYGNIVADSVSLNTSGYIKFNTPSSRSNAPCHSPLNGGDSVRMEVDLDSTPRTVQFFVNGEAGSFLSLEKERHSELTTFLASPNQHLSRKGRENPDGQRGQPHHHEHSTAPK